MRILLTTFWKAPHLGGVWTYMEALRGALEARGHVVDVFTRKPEESASHLVGVATFPYDAYREPLEKACREASLEFSNYTKRFYECDRYCMELAASGLDLASYDVVHAQDVFSANALARVSGGRVPVMVSVHGCITTEWSVVMRGVPPVDFTGYFTAIERNAASRTDVATVQSRWLLEVYRSMIPDVVERLSYEEIYGFDVAAFMAAMGAPLSDSPRRVPRLAPGVVKILYAGRYEEVKNPLHLVRVAARLKSMGVGGWVLWMAGSGNMEREIRELVDRSGLSMDVCILGPRVDLPALLSSVDVLAVPSAQDNHPYVVMEAQVAGKPVVASMAGGIPEMVAHGETGLLSAVDDVGTMAQHLSMLVRDADLRRGMGAAAAAGAPERWSISRAADRVLSLYAGAIESGARREKAGMKSLVIGSRTFTVPEDYEIPDPAVIREITGATVR